MAKSQWSFKTAVELSAALRQRKFPPSNWRRTRSAASSGTTAKINAICVRDFERGLEAARAADAALARGENEAAARHSDDGEGILQYRRAADDMGLSAAEGFRAAGRRAVGHPRQGSRRRHPRQDQRAASGSATGRATTRSTAPPTTPTISAARPAAPPADRRRRWRPATGRSRSAPTSAARCACRHSTAASMRTSRPSAWCRRAAIRRRRFRRLPLERDLAVIGPMARSAADLSLLLDVIAGPDPLDAGVGYKLDAAATAAPRRSGIFACW